MATQIDYVFLGIRGHVVALNRTTGEELWRAQLKGSDYVNVVLDGDLILASTKGEVFCLRAADGKPLWHNRLPGFGMGLMTIATSRAPGGGRTTDAEKRRRDAAAATAASTSAAT